MRALNMAAEPARYYVSLGDSISIDAYAGGPGCGAASLLYRNRDEEFPEWRGRDLRTAVPGARLIPLAADGATSAAVRYAQLPKLREMNVRPSLATVTMGGNDLLQCFGSEDAARHAHRALREHAHATMAGLRDVLLPDAAILVGTIYDPSDGTGDAEAMDLLPYPWPGALEWLNRFNETLVAVAGEHGALVADIRKKFLGHGKRIGDPGQPGAHPKNRELFYCGGIEPNAWGASALRALWWGLLRDAGVVKEAG